VDVASETIAATVRRLGPGQASRGGRTRATFAPHTGLGPASLVLDEVSALHFETDARDGSRRGVTA
jgi:hypothetical protein